MQVELEALLDAVPAALLVLDHDLRIVAVNAAYARGSMSPVQDLIGQQLVERVRAIDPHAISTAAQALEDSLRRVLETGETDVMVLQRLDTPQRPGGATERYWHIVNSAVQDQAGSVTLLVHQLEEVTDLVTATRPHGADHAGSAGSAGSAASAEDDWRDRLADVAPLIVRARELRSAWEAEAVAGRLAAALAAVALDLASADSVEAVSALVTERGLAALGATGGSLSLVVPPGDVIRAQISSALGTATSETYLDLPLDGPLPASVAARSGRLVLLSDRAACVAFAPEMADVIALTGCDAWASIPLPTAGPPIGSMSVGWAESHVVGMAELAALQALAAQATQGLERVRVRALELDRTAATLRMAELMQRSLLTEPPTTDHLEIVVRYHSAAQEAQVGGDWYDAFVTADGAATLVIGDVSGHDTVAAAAMSGVRNMLRGIAYTVGEPPARVLSVLDQAMTGLHVGVLATAVLARVEQTAEDKRRRVRRLRWSNAGHPPPLLLRADGTVSLLRGEPDLMLGIDPETPRSDGAIELAPSDAVLLYTDGLVERRGASIEDGLAWLTQAVASLAWVGVNALVDSLLDQTAAYSEDDIALLALRAHPET